MKKIFLIFKVDHAECSSCRRTPMWDWGGVYCYACFAYWSEPIHNSEAQVMTEAEFRALLENI